MTSRVPTLNQMDSERRKDRKSEEGVGKLSGNNDMAKRNDLMHGEYTLRDDEKAEKCTRQQ